MSNWREMLREAKKLLDEGYINEQDYEKMKQEALALRSQSTNPEVTPPPPSVDMDHLSDVGTIMDGPANAADGPPPDLNDMGTIDGSDDVETIGNYRILHLLGEGGMGLVYKGRHKNEDYAKAVGDVAIKMIQPSLANGAQFKSRFIREAIFGKTLSHPNISKVIDIHDEDGMLALFMDFVEGEELLDMIPSTGLSAERTIELLTPIADALDYLHEKEIVHRDMKPANVRVKSDGTPVILDFGIAKDTNEVDSGMTQTGTVMGTRVYMAPEQMDAKNVTGSADQYALAMMAYQMLTGKLPWPEDTKIDRIGGMKLFGKLEPLETPDTPGLGKAVMRGLKIQPTKRFASCTEFVQAMYKGLYAEEEEQKRLEEERQQEEQQAKEAEAKRLSEEAEAAKLEEQRQLEEERRKIEEEKARLEQEKKELENKAQQAKEEKERREQEAYQKERDELLQRAETLGLSVRKNWKNTTIEKKITEEEARLQEVAKDERQAEQQRQIQMALLEKERQAFEERRKDEERSELERLDRLKEEEANNYQKKTEELSEQSRSHILHHSMEQESIVNQFIQDLQSDGVQSRSKLLGSNIQQIIQKIPSLNDVWTATSKLKTMTWTVQPQLSVCPTCEGTGVATIGIENRDWTWEVTCPSCCGHGCDISEPFVLTGIPTPTTSQFGGVGDKALAEALSKNPIKIILHMTPVGSKTKVVAYVQNDVLLTPVIGVVSAVVCWGLLWTTIGDLADEYEFGFLVLMLLLIIPIFTTMMVVSNILLVKQGEKVSKQLLDRLD